MAASPPTTLAAAGLIAALCAGCAGSSPAGTAPGGTGRAVTPQPATGQPGPAAPVGVQAAGTVAGPAAAAPAAAALPWPSPAPGVPAAPGITVSGTGHASGTPDVLAFTVALTEQAPDAATALDRAGADAGRVRDVLARGGVAPADLATSQVSVQPHYTGMGASSGFDATEAITARVHGVAKDARRAGQLLSDAVHAGGNAARLQSAWLDLGESGGLLDAARQAAFGEARGKAAQYARLAGVHLGAVVALAEGGPGPVIQPYPLGRPLAAGSAAAPVPIEPGSAQVDVTVTVTFAIGAPL